MTTSAQTKPSITREELKQGLKKFLPFSVAKIGETLLDMVITVTMLALTLTWIAALQAVPVTPGELTGYIITLFLLIIILRIVHDFDDYTQTNEVGDLLTELQTQISEVHRLVKSESVHMSDDELEPRLQSLTGK